MDNKESLKKAHQLKRKNLEEQEEALLQQRDKALSIIEEVDERSHHYLKNIIPDNTMLIQGYRQTYHMKNEIIESTKEKRKELTRKIEKCDDAYYRELRKLNENKQ